MTRLDKIRNECIREEFRKIIDMTEKTLENRLRRFGYEGVERKNTSRLRGIKVKMKNNLIACLPSYFFRIQLVVA